MLIYNTSNVPITVMHVVRGSLPIMRPITIMPNGALDTNLHPELADEFEAKVKAAGGVILEDIIGQLT